MKECFFFFPWLSHNLFQTVHPPLKENEKPLSNVKSSELQPVSLFPKQSLLAGGPPSFDRICGEETTQRNWDKKSRVMTEVDLMRLIKRIQVPRGSCRPSLSLCTHTSTHTCTHTYTHSNLLLSSGAALHLQHFLQSGVGRISGKFTGLWQKACTTHSSYLTILHFLT